MDLRLREPGDTPSAGDRRCPNGLEASFAVRDGMTLYAMDKYYESDFDHGHLGDGSFRFHFKLSGCNYIRVENDAESLVQSGSLALVSTPVDMPKTQHMFGKTRERSVTLICHRDFLRRAFHPVASASIPPQIGKYICDDRIDFSFSTVPLSPSLRAFTEEILGSTGDGAMRDLLLEAKGLELFCAAARHVLNSSNESTVSRKDRDRVLQICNVLNAEVGLGMTIGELSRLFAWNDTQMTECFRQVTGTTISRYRSESRLTRARQRLAEKDLPLSEIAFEAGYEYPGNFATAFKRRFGYSPKASRRTTM